MHRDVPSGPDVDLERLAEQGRRHAVVGEVEMARGGGVVDDDVRSLAELRLGAAHDLATVVGAVGQVDRHRRHAAASFLDQAYRLLERASVRAIAGTQRARGREHSDAGCGETLGDRAADSPAGACHDRDIGHQTRPSSAFGVMGSPTGGLFVVCETPPSEITEWPVMYDERSDARKSATPPVSLASPSRPSGGASAASRQNSFVESGVAGCASIFLLPSSTCVLPTKQLTPLPYRATSL